MKKPTIEIYTDGSAKKNRGAWAFVVVQNGKILSENSGAQRKTSSNPMEFQAAIEALTSLPEGIEATLFSDSRILIDSMTIWKGTDLRPGSLALQIDELDRLNERRFITWKWIKAHAGHEFNERCDALCIAARDSL